MKRPRHEQPYKPFIQINDAQRKRARLTADRLMVEPVVGTIEPSLSGKSMCIDLILGSDKNYLTGELADLHGSTIAMINYFGVARQLRGNGIGERLLRTFVAEAKAHGATELWSDNASNMALGLRAKVFGKKALTFYDSENPEIGFLPLTYEQALETNQKIMTALYPGFGEPKYGDIGVYVNLDDVDTDGWPRLYKDE